MGLIPACYLLLRKAKEAQENARERRFDDTFPVFRRQDGAEVRYLLCYAMLDSLLD